MRNITWDYIAGFFDGEGSVSTMNFTHRDTLATTIVTLSQSGSEGLFVLSAIRDFLWERGIKGYIQKAQRNPPYRPMHNFKISSRVSAQAFLAEMLPRVFVKRVAVADTLRFMVAFPSLRSAVTANRNKERTKYGAVVIDAEVLRAERATGQSMKALALKYECDVHTIRKYLDPDYRKRYDAYRNKWRAEKAAKLKAASAA